MSTSLLASTHHISWPLVDLSKFRPFKVLSVILFFSFQDRIQRLEYALVGVYPSQYFFRIDRETGEIYVSQSLKLDNLRLTEYTVRVHAYDTAYPENYNDIDIVITGKCYGLNTACVESKYASWLSFW